jgi:hypothetical protein
VTQTRQRYAARGGPLRGYGGPLYAARGGPLRGYGGPLRGYGGRAATRHKYTIPVQSYFMKPSGDVWAALSRN